MGGVSGRAGVKAGGSNPSASSPSRVVTVTGIPLPGKAALFAGRRPNERLGRSVALFRASTRSRRRADDSGCPEAAEEGNVVAPALLKHRHRRTHERSSHAHGRRVLRSVLRPVRVNPHYARGAKASSWWGDRIRYHGWANPRKWEEPALGPDGRTKRGSPRVTALARERRGTEEKEGGQGRRPCEDHEPGFALVRRVKLQKSEGDLWPRISSAHALRKERSGSSERGPSQERRSAGETVGGRFGRTVGRVPCSLANVRVRIGTGLRMVRECHPAVATSPRRCSGRGTGAVTATGSHEGLPSDGRHPGSSRSVFGHAKRSRKISAHRSHPPTRAPRPKAADTARTGSSGEGWRGVRTRAARDRDVRGSVGSTPWERQRPRS